MKYTTLCLTIVLALAWIGAVAEDDAAAASRSPEALEILKRVDEAAKAVDAVSCHVKLVPSGIATNFVSAGEGKSLMQGWNNGMPQRFTWVSRATSACETWREPHAGQTSPLWRARRSTLTPRRSRDRSSETISRARSANSSGTRSLTPPSASAVSGCTPMTCSSERKVGMPSASSFARRMWAM